jgi:hypothetical protein
MITPSGPANSLEPILLISNEEKSGRRLAPLVEIVWGGEPGTLPPIPKSLLRPKKRKRLRPLSPADVEYRSRLKNLKLEVVKFFGGNEAAARTWMNEPRPIFGGKNPKELARTEEGAKQVSTLIYQLENGIVV